MKNEETNYKRQTIKTNKEVFNKEHRKLELEIIKKDIDIIQFLSELGHKPAKWNYNRVWYISPIRKPENTPSFCVYTDQNTWYDFGSKLGGSIIDFVMNYFSMSYVETIRMLRKKYNHLITNVIL